MSDVIGSGSDTLVFQMSGDADGPAGVSSSYPEFTVNVDGQQIGGLQTVTASHAAGEDQTFTFQGNYAQGPHTVTATFANNNGTPGDKSNVDDGGDRNVYVDNLTYDGQQVTNGTAPIYESPLYPPNGTDTVHPGNAVFTVNDTTPVPAGAPSTPTTTPSPIDYGSGPDSLTLNMAEDPYAGDAQFNVAVDGKQVGGTFTTTAVQWEGQEQAFNLQGDWGSGAHTVSVTYLSNTAGAFDAQGNAYDNVDQNLYVHSISYDGVQASGAPWELYSDGTQDFNVAAGGQPGGGTTSGSDATNAGSTGSSSGNDTTTTTGTLPSSTGSSSDTTTSTGSGDGTNATITPGTLTSDGSSPSSDGTSSGMTFVPPAGSDTGSTAAPAGGTNGSSSLDLSSGGLDAKTVTALQQGGGSSRVYDGTGGGNLGAGQFFSTPDTTGWSGLHHAGSGVTQGH